MDRLVSASACSQKTDRFCPMTRLAPSIFLLLALALPACTSTPAPALRGETAQRLAAEGGMSPRLLKTGMFDLMSFERANPGGDQAVIYIEGDGYGWVNRSTLSNDPTPATHTLLELALQDSHPAVSYLARPCQYVGGLAGRNCTNNLWDEARFSPDVLKSMGEAIDQIKARSGASSVSLVGHSGGGVVALLLAARRNDVKWVITVAAPIDTDYFTSLHHVSSFDHAANPTTYAAKLADIPQGHYVGDGDEAVPASIGRAYLSTLPHRRCARLTVVPGADHIDGWTRAWPGILRSAPSCANE